MSLNRFKRFLFLLPIVIAIGITIFIFIKNQNQPLLNPYAGKDKILELLEPKISTDFSLDFSRSKTLESLSVVPRYLVYNAKTGRVYYSQNSDQIFHLASFTKLMTAQVALDLAPLDTPVEVSELATNKIPTILGIKKAEKFTISELLRGAIATSANDAAQALADGAAAFVSRTPSDFIAYMNYKTKLLGLKNTRFANPDGLDDETQYSTLNDIVLIIHNLRQNYPAVIKAGNSDMEDIVANEYHGHYYLPNWNGLLGVYPGVNGLKIAYTEGAGYSSIVTFSQDNLELVAIVSGTSSYLERDLAAANLLDATLITEKISPKNITKTQLNLHYKVWGDLARQIRSELATIEATSSSNLP